MAQDTSQCLQIGSSNNDGIGKGNDNNDAAANVTKGYYVIMFVLNVIIVCVPNMILL